jgi:DNA-directed RNA polymerase subunit RPC12/RpoP
VLAKYKNAVDRSYGWNVDLVCGHCKTSVMPRYEGWSPHMAKGAGDATIVAKLACPVCGQRLINEPVRKLIDLFANVPVSERNNRIVKEFIAGLIIVPLVFAFVLFLGLQMGWWGNNAFGLLVLSSATIPLLVMLKTYRIARLRSVCACNRPAYRFLGTLEGTSCYSCSSCGRLLRLQE